jgi:hypothetical protein
MNSFSACEPARFRERLVDLGDPAIRALDQPESAWNEAAAATRQADPFCCRTEWQLSFAQSRHPDRKLLVRHHDGSLIAFSESLLSSGVPILSPLDNLWLFGSPLLGQHAVDLLDDLTGELGNTQGPSPVIAISGLRPGGVLLRKLQTRFQSRYRFQRLNQDVLCGASLRGGLDGFLSRRSANHRRNLRKQGKRARAQGVEFERFSPLSDQDVLAIYDRMIRVERASWKGAGQCGMAEPFPRRYYLNMLKRLAVSGSARIILAQHQGKDIGFIFGGVVNGIYRGQQFSFDRDWHKYSIGNLMQLQQVQWLCEEDARRYDLGPLMGYKHHWAEKHSRIEAWAMIPG